MGPGVVVRRGPGVAGWDGALVAPEAGTKYLCPGVGLGAVWLSHAQLPGSGHRCPDAMPHLETA